MAHFDDQATQKANLGYIKNSMNEPLLEREHEFDLARRWRDQKDEKALHEMVRAYTRLVVAMAMKFKHYGLPVGDLIQEGNIGLMEAANRFDPERDIRFSTYASWWIRSTIQDYVLRNWSIVRTGTTAAHKSLFFNFRRLRSKIESMEQADQLNDNGRQKIAEELNVRVKDVEVMEGRLSASDKSLNGVIGFEGETQWQDLLEDSRENPEEVMIGTHDGAARSKWLAQALGLLNDREQHIIRQRSLGEEVITLEALGQELGVSKERVRQLEQRAMEKMKISLLEISGKDDMFAAA